MTNTQRVTFPSSAGEASGVLISPSGSEAAPAVVVVQEWWGVNEQIQSIAQRYADAGFVAIVPDLYHGVVAQDAAEAERMMKALDFGKAIQEIAGAVDFVRARSNGKVAVTGYCMGGAATFAAAVNIRGLAAVVPYYGLPGDLDWSKIDAPIQAHFALHDEWATVAGAQKIKAAIPSLDLHVYDAQHAFCNDRRPDVYNPEAAKQAWHHTLEFIRRHTA